MERQALRTQSPHSSTCRRNFATVACGFWNICWQSHAGGLVETKRGTTDATYLYYTLGKLQILKLRDDLKKKEGAKFSLQQFHDDFLKQGFPPIRIVRRALLGDDSPTL